MSTNDTVTLDTEESLKTFAERLDNPRTTEGRALGAAEKATAKSKAAQWEAAEAFVDLLNAAKAHSVSERAMSEMVADRLPDVTAETVRKSMSGVLVTTPEQRKLLVKWASPSSIGVKLGKYFRNPGDFPGAVDSILAAAHDATPVAVVQAALKEQFPTSGGGTGGGTDTNDNDTPEVGMPADDASDEGRRIYIDSFMGWLRRQSPEVVADVDTRVRAILAEMKATV